MKTLFVKITFTLDTIKHYLWMIHVFYVTYWKECHSQDIELVQKTLETVYGSDKQTMTYAALHWMYHHSHLKVTSHMQQQGQPTIS